MWLVAVTALPVAWLGVHLGGLSPGHGQTALLSGAAIFGAAFLLSWATEVAQLDIPRALAISFLALIAVFPEYAVDVYFAWRAGRDPIYTAYATANMTGSNRLLIGVGWAVPVVAYAIRTGRREIVLPREQAVEVNYLAAATLYSFVIPAKATLALYDTAILLVLFIAYSWAAARTHHEEPELAGPAEAIARLGRTGRRIVVLAIFLFAGAAIFTAAEPFAESLIALGRELGIDEYLLVQWVAPLASESPEFVVALLFALKGAAAAGMATMISSKVNQWTLLVGALPAAYALSGGHLGAMPLDARQREEIFLTSAQSLFGLVVIANFRFSLAEAALLFGLFVPQFVFTHPRGRMVEAAAYLALTVVWLAASRDVRTSARHLLPRLPRRKRR